MWAQKSGIRRSPLRQKQRMDMSAKRFPTDVFPLLRPTSKVSILVTFCFFCIYWCACIWRIQDTMESYLEEDGRKMFDSLRNMPQRLSKRRRTMEEREASGDAGIVTKRSADLPQRFLVWSPMEYGQGAGQQVNGLLAAHLLGDEFDRVVCVDPKFEGFLVAFEPIHPAAIQGCPHAFEVLRQYSANNPRPSLETYNFYGPLNECKIKEALEATETTVLFLKGNSYPRWPTVPDGYFHRFYRPRQALLDVLPWKNDFEPPTIVVHLRHGDNQRDNRRGVDDVSLELLGRSLEQKHPDSVEGSTPFLVTNYVAWYQYFHDTFQWQHPPWVKVKHSAIDSVDWGSTSSGPDSGIKKIPYKAMMKRQNLQLWSDWWTILNAKHVYHTHSDFSLSAVHWASDALTAKTIQGPDDSDGLILLDEPWIRDGVAEPLRTRTDLRCKDPTPSELGELRMVRKKKRTKQQDGEGKLRSEDLRGPKVQLTPAQISAMLNRAHQQRVEREQKERERNAQDPKGEHRERPDEQSESKDFRRDGRGQNKKFHDVAVHHSKERL